MADTLAKQHNLTLAQPMEQVPLINCAACQVNINGQTITHSLAKELHQAYTLETSTIHLTHRINLHSNYRTTIAWNEFAQALKSFTTNHQRILRRWIYGFLPMQQRLHRNGTSSSPMCPNCQQHVETDEHFLTCGGASSWQEYLLNPLDALFHKAHAGQ